jgi:glucans biosynthesis protein
VSRFQFEGLKGFGLMQRDREPDRYRDNEAQYHLRPNVWIRPRDAWGAGAVELLELPTDTETADNVAAYWVPKQPVRAGDALSLAYQVSFANADPEEHRGGRIISTQVERRAGRDVRFSLLMEGGELRTLEASAEPQPVVTASRGRVADAACSRLAGGAWQLRFTLARAEDGPSELRAFVRQGPKVLTETWGYLCS